MKIKEKMAKISFSKSPQNRDKWRQQLERQNSNQFFRHRNCYIETENMHCKFRDHHWRTRTKNQQEKNWNQNCHQGFFQKQSQNNPKTSETSRFGFREKNDICRKLETSSRVHRGCKR